MFGVPTRVSGKNGPAFSLDVNATPLGVSLSYDTHGLVYDETVQSRFRTLQSLVLSELSKEHGLFKNPPSLTALAAISPNWGFVSSGTEYVFTPYADLISDIAHIKLPCLVDIQLKRLEISRSTIRPTFKLHYLGPAQTAIDFDWPAPSVSNDEIIEVSDVPTSGSSGPMITLADPAAAAREKAAAKSTIRAAFAAASTAREEAEKLAQDFYDKYDLSDSESAFSEWISDTEVESDSD